jgi:hypothetical protein
VGPAPLPPHERTWRHPSELAADERDLVRLSEVPSSTRTFAMVTGTVGLLAVAALMLTVTPRRDGSPVALESTTLPGVQVASLAAITTTEPAPPRSLALTAASMRLATPIGDGKQALMTLVGGVGATGTELDVRLTSGPVVTAVVSLTTDEMVVVSIDAGEQGHTVASGLPSPDEIVTVMVDPPVTVAFADIDEVEADEGTPVLDDQGDLIGLCTHRRGATTEVVDVTGTGGVADTTQPTTLDPAAESTAPATSVPGSSVTPPSAPASTGAATSAAP